MARKKKTFVLNGWASMEFVVKSTHPHFDNDDILREYAVEAWRNANSGDLTKEGKPSVEDPE